MTYEVGYLYQSSRDGKDFANGFGPLQDNLVIVFACATKREALAKGAALIGSKSPLGVYADAYLVHRTARSTQVLGEILKDATLDQSAARAERKIA